MKKFFKHILSVLIAVAAGFSVVACGVQDSPVLPGAEADDRMPVIKINTEGGVDITGNEIDQPYFRAGISVSNCPAAFAFTNAAAEVKVRGNDSATYEKKPFRIKFEKAAPMAGLNGGRAFKNWVLLSELKDASFLRNAGAFYMADKIMDEHIYVSDYRHVEVYVNEDYRGVYLLAEQQQVNEGRVMNKEEASPDYTGTDIPYFFEITANANSLHKERSTGRWFTLSYQPMRTVTDTAAVRVGTHLYRIRNDISVSAPGNGTESTIVSAQRTFLKNHVQNAYNTCYDAAYRDIYPSGMTSARAAAESVIDLNSLVNMYILCDFVCDIDLDYGSFFFSLDMSPSGNKKLTFDAPWDFDVSQGLFNPETSVRYAGGGWGTFNYVNTSGIPGRDWVNTWRGNQNAWFLLFAKEPWFQNLVAARWKELTDAKLLEGLVAYQDGITAKYQQQFARNFERWPISPHVQHYMTVEEVDAHKNQTEAAGYLKTWHAARYAAMSGVYLTN